MTDQIFAVYDSAASRYLTPFFAPTVEFAIREFRRAVNTPEHQFSKYPQDYTLFHIGQYDAEEAHLDAWPPRSLGVAITFVEKHGQQLNLLEKTDA